MTEYPLINKKEFRKNRQLRRIRKESRKKYSAVKGHFPKARIGKLVRLREKDNYYDLTGNSYPEQKMTDIDCDFILSAIKDRKVMGLSGSGFPADQKLLTLINSTAADKYLIINGAECDPGLLQDEWLVNNRLDEIEKGIELLAKCTPFKRIILASKEDMCSSSCVYELYQVPNNYPIGAEKLLIREVLGIELEPDELPAVKGILVLNVQTVHAIYEAVRRNRPADSRLITVADLNSGEAVIVRVNINSYVKDILSKIPAYNKPVYFGGGIMMARKAADEDKITVKTNFIGYGKEAPLYQEADCKKCGACTRKCPMQIKVHEIIQCIERKDLSDIKQLHPDRCIQCGTCTYFCHAGKNVMEIIYNLKENTL